MLPKCGSIHIISKHAVRKIFHVNAEVACEVGVYSIREISRLTADECCMCLIYLANFRIPGIVRKRHARNIIQIVHGWPGKTHDFLRLGLS